MNVYRARQLVVPLLLAASAIGCDQFLDVEIPTDQRLGPLRVGPRAVWLDRGLGRIVALDPTARPPVMTGFAAARSAIFAVPQPGSARLLVLNAGSEALKKGDVAEEPSLEVIDPALPADKAVVARYPLPASFDRLAVSPDGRRAIAHYSPSPPESLTFFRNLNELAFVDLDKPAGAQNPASRTIRSLGGAPLGIAFSPDLPIPAPAGRPHALAVVLATDYLTFLDLDHPERVEITVPLRDLDDSGGSIVPQQVVFAKDSGTVYVRASGSADVFGIFLEPRVPDDAAQNDFVPRINQPSAGRTARDMLLYTDGGRTFILAANQTRDLALIDPATSEFAIIPMAEEVSNILAVPAEAPTTAVLFSRTARSTSLYLVTLAGLDKALSRGLQRRTVSRPVRDVIAVPGTSQLLVMHDDQRTVVSVIDLGPRRTDAPIDGRVPLGSFDFLADRFLVGVSPSLARVGLLDLTDLSTRDVRLDAPPQRVLVVGGSVIVDHDQPAGLVTVLPTADATRDDAFVLQGFFLEGLLDASLRTR